MFPPSQGKNLQVRPAVALLPVLLTRVWYKQDKTPLFIFLLRDAKQPNFTPAKFAKGSTIRLLLADRHYEPLNGYIGGHGPTISVEDEIFDHEHGVHAAKANF